MLSLAALGFAVYGLYEVVSGTVDVLTVREFEVLVDIGSMLFGLLLMLSSAFVRVRLPGGLALAIGSLLALQSLGIHNQMHVYGTLSVLPETARAVFAVALVGLAYAGDRGREGKTPAASR